MNNKSKRYQVYICHHYGDGFPVFESDITIPIQAGRAISPISSNMIGDDEGDNISNKCNWYSEYTATYWAWKHSPAQYIGWIHYRRIPNLGYWYTPRTRSNFDPQSICLDHGITRKNIELLLSQYEAVVMEPITLLPSILQQYINCHIYAQDFYDTTISVIQKKYPQMLSSVKHHFTSETQGYFKCQILARREFFNEYMDFEFSIFQALEEKFQKHLEKEGKSAYRLYAFMGERLLSAFINYKIKEEHKPIKTVPVPEYTTVNDLYNYSNNLYSSYRSFLNNFHEEPEYLRYLFFHQKTTNSDDKRISLNINYIDWNGNERSAIYRNKHFHVYPRDSKQKLGEFDFLEFWNESGQKCRVKYSLEQLQVQVKDGNYNNVNCFTYKTWNNEGYYTSYLIKWNEPWTNYLSDPSLNQKSIFLFRKPNTNYYTTASSKIYCKTQNCGITLHQIIETEGGHSPNKNFQVILKNDIPYSQDQKKKNQSSIQYINQKNEEISLSIYNKQFITNGSSSTIIIPDWDDEPYEVSIGTWFPYSVYLQ